MTSDHEPATPDSATTPDATPTSSAVSPSEQGARGLAQIAIFAGVIAAMGLVPPIQFPGMSVPITLQTLGVMLAGAILGARKGFASVLLFLALVAIGLPLLSGGRGGLGVFATPSVGFLIGWPIGALVIGWLVQRRGVPYRIGWGIVANIVGGIIVIYAFGLVGMMLVGDLTMGAAAVALLPFIPGDIVKAVLAALIAKSVHSSYPGLIKARRAARSESGAEQG